MDGWTRVDMETAQALQHKVRKVASPPGTCVALTYRFGFVEAYFVDVLLNVIPI